MKRIWVILLALLLLLSGCYPRSVVYSHSVQDVPEFSGKAYVVLNDNQPEFTSKDYSETAYESYSELDYLERCGVAMACLGPETMPTEDRESISHIKPSGWVQAQYDTIDGTNLYNRCHLIGFQLCGENDNAENLITGTRYLNVEGMLPFENMVADYIKETGNHVLYRVTPIFDENCLVARGVQMEAMSVEDSGAGICFHIFAYNNQPGIVIDYKTGESAMEGVLQEQTAQTEQEQYILNTSSKKIHKADCKQGQSIKAENIKITYISRQELLEDGYTPAGCCDP